jgi:hypothetical protein
MDLAGRIIESCTPPQNVRLRDRRELMLIELQKEIREATQSLQQSDKEKLVTGLFRAQKTALDQSPEAFPEEKTAPEIAAVAPPAEQEPEASSETPGRPPTPEQNAMIEKLKSVNFGTWFEFSKENGTTQRAKLSWRSTITEKFMFVDQMGVKAAVISMYELADCMLNGKARIVKAEKKPFVDRALSAIHRMLDHGTRESAQA